MWYDFTGSWHHSFLNFIGVGVAVEVGSAWVNAYVKNEVERREKIVGYVTREGDPNMVAVEVGSAWVKANVKNEVERREKS